MIEKKCTPTIRIIALLAACMVACTKISSESYVLHVVKHEQGWGYEICKNKKPFIYQEYIPAIEGRIPFSDKNSARKTGKRVLKKLRNHQSPTITRTELVEMGVIEE
ncbi:MAG: DUF4907 domain-containing protein [Bacteroidales bacterium]|nr:DUF4907 domain-containing protein [Bacteroidales bacterium]